MAEGCLTCWGLRPLGTHVYSSRAHPESELSEAWCRLRPPLLLLLPDEVATAHDPAVLKIDGNIFYFFELTLCFQDISFLPILYVPSMFQKLIIVIFRTDFHFLTWCATIEGALPIPIFRRLLTPWIYILYLCFWLGLQGHSSTNLYFFQHQVRGKKCQQSD